MAGNKRRNGFTLVEMMVVVALLVVVMAFVVPSFTALAAQNERASCMANMRAIGQALLLFREDYQCWPPDGTEWLWTEQAVADYRAAYGTVPPGDHTTASPIGAAYDPGGAPIATSLVVDGEQVAVRGLGLWALYYVGAYAEVVPPQSLEPRLTADRRAELTARREGLNGLAWFRGSRYITKPETFHCPASENEIADGDMALRAQLPFLGGWGSYDCFYRRNHWHVGRPIPGVTDNRHLFQPYPPSDTVVLWCPYHRKSRPPSRPGEPTILVKGDMDLVLYADGSVRRRVARADGRTREDSPAAPWSKGL